jgi:hypothetical protein
MPNQPPTSAQALTSHLLGSVIACLILAPIAYLLGLQPSIIIGGVVFGLLLTVAMFYWKARNNG